MKRIVHTLLIVSVLFIGGCASPASTTAKEDALLVYPAASDISYSEVKGTFQVRYRVAVSYPAQEVIDWLSNELSRRGWKPLAYDFLDPKIKLSHITGWTEFADVQTPVEYKVRQWLANWEHPSGSIVRYQLQYRYPKLSAPNLSDLSVIAIYIQADLAKQVKDWKDSTSR